MSLACREAGREGAGVVSFALPAGYAPIGETAWLEPVVALAPDPRQADRWGASADIVQTDLPDITPLEPRRAALDMFIDTTDDPDAAEPPVAVAAGQPLTTGALGVSAAKAHSRTTPSRPGDGAALQFPAGRMPDVGQVADATPPQGEIRRGRRTAPAFERVAAVDGPAGDGWPEAGGGDTNAPPREATLYGVAIVASLLLTLTLAWIGLGRRSTPVPAPAPAGGRRQLTAGLSARFRLGYVFAGMEPGRRSPGRRGGFEHDIPGSDQPLSLAASALSPETMNAVGAIASTIEGLTARLAGLKGAGALSDVLSAELDALSERLVSVASSAGADGPEAEQRAAPALRNLVRELERIRRIIDSAAVSLKGGPSGHERVPATRAEAYELLGLNPEAPEGTLKKVADGLRMSWHPDHARDDEDRQAREARIKAINTAVDLITGKRSAA